MVSMLRNRSGALLLGIVGLAVFAILNLSISALTGVRIDLTQDKLFTLSEGTKNILKSMNKPATLTLYYSRELGEAAPPLGLHATRVRDILKEFAANSHDPGPRPVWKRGSDQHLLTPDLLVAQLAKEASSKKLPTIVSYHTNYKWCDRRCLGKHSENVCQWRSVSQIHATI